MLVSRLFATNRINPYSLRTIALCKCCGLDRRNGELRTRRAPCRRTQSLDTPCRRSSTNCVLRTAWKSSSIAPAAIRIIVSTRCKQAGRQQAYGRIDARWIVSASVQQNYRVFRHLLKILEAASLVETARFRIVIAISASGV